MKIRRNIIFPVRTGPQPRISLYRYLLSVGAATRRPPDDTVIVPYARAVVWRCRPDFTGARQRGGADRQSDPPTARRILSVRQTAESSRPEPVAAAAGASRFLRIAGRRVLRRRYQVTVYLGTAVTDVIFVLAKRSPKGRGSCDVWPAPVGRRGHFLGVDGGQNVRPSCGVVSNGARVGGGCDDSSVSRILSPTRLDGPCRRGAHTAAAASQESVLVRRGWVDGGGRLGGRRWWWRRPFGL